MATKQPTPTSTNIIELIQNQTRAIQLNDNNDDDIEWSLFTRFSETIFRFARQQMNNDTDRSNHLKDFGKAKSCDDCVELLINNEKFGAVIEMLIKETVSGKKKSAKSPDAAKSAREQGNELFRSKNYIASYDKYSEVSQLNLKLSF